MAVTLTPKAAEKVRSLMAQPAQQQASGLRLKVVGGGCAGLTYQLVLERDAAATDRVFESEGVRIFVDPKSSLYVDGTEIDYQESLMGSGFAFRNPNAGGGCGCGTSFHA